MTFPDIQKIWKEVERRTSKQNRAEIPTLKNFLIQNLDNPHARVLTGYSVGSLADAKSVEALQALIINKHRNSRAKLSQWLGICHVALDEMCRHGYPVPLSDLAPYLPPSPSPFASLIPLENSQTRRHPPSAKAILSWRDSLNRWIRTKAEHAQRNEWNAAILLSAIIHGALLDNIKIKLLLGYLNKNQKPDVAARIGTYCFNLPYQGLGDYHLQRWIVDPVTELLILNQPTEGSSLDESTTFPQIQAIISDQLANEDRPQNIHEVIKAARTWWSTRTAQIDIQGISRQFYTHAFHPRTWTRLFNDTTYEELEKNDQKSYDKSEDDRLSVEDETRALFPWLSAIDDVYGAPNKPEALKVCEALIDKHKEETPAFIYLGWLRALLLGESSSGNALAFLTIKKRYLITTRQLLAVCGDANLTEMSLEELEDIYSDLTSDHYPFAYIKPLTQGLRDFHRYLVNHHKQRPIRHESEILGSDSSLKPVDAALISFDDYELIQKWLAKHLKTSEWQVSKLVCMLAFKCGMRRMEIFGLRVDDIQTDGPLTIVLRPHPDRGLKTQNSRRIIPARLLLSQSMVNSPSEARFLKDWVNRRKIEIESAGNQSSPHIFPEFSDPCRQTWVDKIYKKIRNAIRHVTGDKHLYLHHLRHSFGTWNYLRLRAPDYPMVAMYFQNNPQLEKTYAFLKNSKRARVLLMGPAEGPRRGYAYTVAKLLGHASPAVSLGHYIHSNDFFLGSATWRESINIPKTTWIGLSSRSKSVNYDRLKELSGPAYFNDIAEILDIERRTLEHSSIQEDVARKIRPLPKTCADKTDINTTLDFERCSQIFTLAINEQRPFDEIALRLQLPTQRISTVVGRALEWMGELVLKEKRLYLPRTPEEISFFQDMEKRLGKLSKDNPALFELGLSLHLQHYYPIKGDVVFRGKKHLEHLEEYLSFLLNLGLKSSNLRWEVRYDHESLKPPKWATETIRKMGRVKVHNFGPQSKLKASSYAEWIGLTFLAENQKGSGVLMATATFLSMIGFEGSAPLQST